MRTAVVAFSGVEGAGKSTWARAAREHLERRGLRCEGVEFIGLGLATRLSRAWHRLRGTRPRPRDFASMARAEAPPAGGGRGAPRWKLSHLRRAATHLVDVLLLRLHLARSARRGVEAVVLDRYFFDALVRWNPPPALLRLLEATTPRPDLAFLLEVDPRLAEARRAEGAAAVAARRAEGFARAAARHPEWIRVRSEEADATRRAVERALDAWLETRPRR